MQEFSDVKFVDVNEKSLISVGFDSSYLKNGLKKHKFYSLKISDLSCAQANIIKQAAISAGTDCAVHREVITGKIEKSDCILSGTENQLIKISQKLKFQPFKLNKLAEKIENMLNLRLKPIEIRDKLINWKKPLLMGILNVTPDSFSDGGEHNCVEKATIHYKKLVNDGANIIDIGGESTRPNAKTVPVNEEISRILPIIEAIREFDQNSIISIDTRNAQTAEIAINAGADIINDISALKWDEKMADVAKKYGCPIILNHILDNPTNFCGDIVNEIYNFFLERIDFCISAGIERKNIILDPGIGFGKNIEQNYEIIRRIKEFRALNQPILVGHSRKRYLQEILATKNNETLDEATVAVSQALLREKVNILRVHNVEMHKNLLKISEKLDIL